MKRRYLVICLLLLIQGTVRSQSYRINGFVLDAESSQPLEGAYIFLNVDSYATFSEAGGSFDLVDVPKGTYEIRVSYVGKNSFIDTLDIQSDVTLEIALSNDPTLLNAIEVEADRSQEGISRLRAVEDMAIYAAKKNELILIDNLVGNKAANTSRQVYAKVAGLNIWESDGAGVQLGIGGRGLSPSRNSNFNTRQNGYDISADALGYPESYYTPPVLALDRIEVIRGAASLQYGTQFGGMLNFRFKRGGSKQKPFELFSQQTVGSFGFFNTFNSIGWNTDKANFYGFYQYKKSDGWRPNSSLDQHTAFAAFELQLSDKFRIRPEFTSMEYVAQQPGGLTDAQFEMDPRQSNRLRNWFAVNWNLMALDIQYDPLEQFKINSRFFGLLAGRDALGNLTTPNLIDQNGPRDFLSDDFQNWGNETRLLWQYSTGQVPSSLLIGGRYYNGLTLRRQGLGDDGNEATFEYNNPAELEGSDFRLPSENIAFFAENVWNISDRWSVTPGIRWEYIHTATDGYYRILNQDLAGNIIRDERVDEARENERTIFLAGIGLAFKPNNSLEVYGNISQNYRAINFNDIRVNVGNLVVDENIQDERGFTLDIGARGNFQERLYFDASLYHLNYKDRIGTILKREPNPVFNNLVDRIIRFRSNIADARIYGVESLIEWHVHKSLWENPNWDVRLFTNISYTDARYTNSDANGVDGNVVELVPTILFKAGLQTKWKSARLNIQYAYTDEHFSDASNAIRTPTAVEGLIPAYEIWDVGLSYTFTFLEIEAGINNMLNAIYFTRRASGYPGPGIIPSDGRSYYVSVGFRL